MVSGGISCVKYLLFCFNLLFAISGIAILTVGAIVYISYSHYQTFVDESYHFAPLVLIIVGVIIFIVAFFGCCGAVKENNCMIITFSVLLGIIFALEIAAGIVGYVGRTEVEKMLEKKLNSSMYDYYSDNSDNIVAKNWDIAQHELQCCGMKGPEDWRKVNHNDSLPNTCCPDTPKDQSCTIRSTDKFTDSCLDKLKDLLLTYAYVIGAVGLGIAASQLLGIVFACALARNIRREYETV